MVHGVDGLYVLQNVNRVRSISHSCRTGGNSRSKRWNYTRFIALLALGYWRGCWEIVTFGEAHQSDLSMQYFKGTQNSTLSAWINTCTPVQLDILHAAILGVWMRINCALTESSVMRAHLSTFVMIMRSSNRKLLQSSKKWTRQRKVK
jgi:hypothetical protein